LSRTASYPGYVHKPYTSSITSLDKGIQLKFTKLYKGSDLASLLKLYVRDLFNPAFRDKSYEDTSTGARAIVLK
jgi:hypothetical protein